MHGVSLAFRHRLRACVCIKSKLTRRFSASRTHVGGQPQNLEICENFLLGKFPASQTATVLENASTLRFNFLLIIHDIPSVFQL